MDYMEPKNKELGPAVLLRYILILRIVCASGCNIALMKWSFARNYI